MSNANDRSGKAPPKQYVAGAPTTKTTTQFFDLMDTAQQSAPLIPNLDMSYDPNQPGDPAIQFQLKNQGKFPIRPIPHDKYDTMWKIKQDLQADGAITAARPLPFTEEDIRYLESKAAVEDYAAFLTWESFKYDLSDPATRDWFHKVCPSFFEQREQVIDDLIDTSAKYAKIRLRGPRSEDDMKLEFLVESGKMELPKGPIWDPLSMMEQSIDLKLTDTHQEIQDKVIAYNQKVYSAGMFSPLKPTPASNVDVQEGNNQMGMAPNQFNRSDIAGNKAKRFTGIYGSLPPVSDSYGEYAKRNLGFNERVSAYNNNTRDYKTNTQKIWSNMISGESGQKVGAAQMAPPQPGPQPSFLARINPFNYF